MRHESLTKGFGEDALAREFGGCFRKESRPFDRRERGYAALPTISPLSFAANHGGDLGPEDIGLIPDDPRNGAAPEEGAYVEFEPYDDDDLVSAEEAEEVVAE